MPKKARQLLADANMITAETLADAAREGQLLLPREELAMSILINKEYPPAGPGHHRQ